MYCMVGVNITLQKGVLIVAPVHQFWVQSALPIFNSVRIILRYMSGSSDEELNLVVSEIC